MTSIAVVIATRDRIHLLEGALEALESSLRAPDRVVVVDSASSDPRVARIARTSGTEVVRAEHPGACRARNIGWSSVSEEIVAFIDDDCLVAPDWVGAVVRAFDHECGPSFVTGQVRSDVTPSAHASLSLALITNPEPKVLRCGDDLRTMGHGANLAWRRESLEKVGGFDEQLGPGAPLRAAEDLDLIWRALSVGMVGFYTPEALVVHRQWRSRAEMLRAYHAYGVGSGALAMKRHRLGDRAEQSGPKPSLWRSLLVEEGLIPVRRALAERYEMGAVAEVAKCLGAVRGAYRASRLEVRDGHFVVEA